MRQIKVLISLIIVSLCLSATVKADIFHLNPSKSPQEYKDQYLFWESEQDTSKMEKILKKAYKYYPEENYFVLNYVSIKLQQKEYNAARKCLKRVKKKVPNEPLYIYLWAQIEESYGNFDDAESAYLQTLSLDPNYVGAIVGMGGIYYRRGLRSIANAALEKMPEEMGIKAASPKFKIALQYLQKARTYEGDNLITLRYMLDIYKRLGNSEKYNEIRNTIEELAEE